MVKSHQNMIPYAKRTDYMNNQIQNQFNEYN